MQVLVNYQVLPARQAYFVLWKENEVVAKVDRANAPELTSLISENMPSLLDGWISTTPLPFVWREDCYIRQKVF